MRINQFIATSSGLSRRAADEAVAAGRIAINGQPAAVGQRIEPDHDRITLDGRPLQATSARNYIMLHKPVGYVSSHTKQGSAPTLYELLPSQYQTLRFAGRLDRDSSGLVLLTNDGDFIQRYTHPSNNKDKHYELTLNRTVSSDDCQRLESGVMLDDGPSRVRVLALHGPNITVAISEGRNRQLRRTFGALGYGVKRLHRLSIGPFRLGNLAEGSWKPFTPVSEGTA